MTESFGKSTGFRPHVKSWEVGALEMSSTSLSLSLSLSLSICLAAHQTRVGDFRKLPREGRAYIFPNLTILFSDICNKIRTRYMERTSLCPLDSG